MAAPEAAMLHPASTATLAHGTSPVWIVPPGEKYQKKVSRARSRVGSHNTSRKFAAYMPIVMPSTHDSARPRSDEYAETSTASVPMASSSSADSSAASSIREGCSGAPG